MKVSITKIEEVNISNSQAKEIAIKYFQEEYKLSPHMWIENGILKIEEEEFGGSHSWYTTKIIREASKTDKIMLKALREIFF